MSKFNGPATISQITKCLKNNKHNVKINLNVISQFEQGTEFPMYREPKKIEIETSIASKSINEDKTSLIYNYNQIINIPKKLNEGFDNKLDLNYYIFGVPQKDSFFHSLLYVVSKEFKLKKEDVRLDYVTTLKETMIEKLPKLFRDNKYSKYNYKRAQIEDNFEDTTNISEGLMCLASDYFGINLIVLNYDTDKYWLGKEYDETLNEKNVVLVYSNGVYLPVIHIYGEFPDNFIYKCVLNRFKIYRNLATKTELSVVEQETVKTNDATEEPKSPKPGSPVLVETSSAQEKPQLRGFSGYKLPELRELATQFGIEFQVIDSKTNKSKPKTKKQLYDELNAL